MNTLIRTLALLPVALPVLLAGQLTLTSQAQAVTEIGGQKIVTLTRKAVSTTKPEFTSITLAPGGAWKSSRLRPTFPARQRGCAGIAGSGRRQEKAGCGRRRKRRSELSAGRGLPGSLSQPDSRQALGRRQDHHHGVAWPHAHLPANSSGKLPTAERHAMHGLILKAKTDDVAVKEISGGQEVTGVITRDFGGHWLSKTDLRSRQADRRGRGRLDRRPQRGQRASPSLSPGIPTSTCLGRPQPGYGAHPGLDPGRGGQLRQRLPHRQGSARGGTRFDLRAAGGKALGKEFFDDNWNHLEWKDRRGDGAGGGSGRAATEWISKACRKRSAHPDVRPAREHFVAIEHQYNFGDPFGKEWGSTDTHGDAEAGPEHQVACAAEGVCAVGLMEMLLSPGLINGLERCATPAKAVQLALKPQ